MADSAADPAADPAAAPTVRGHLGGLRYHGAMLSLILALAAGSADWNDYRVPGRDGHADGAALSTSWSE